jgi:two-component system, cell cycle sensor histidine kinase and response regulator CckA
MSIQTLQIFSPPVFENEDKTRTASLLNIILLSVFVIASILTLTTLVIRGSHPTFLGRLVACIVTAMLTLVMWFIMRRGHIQLVSMLFSSMLFVIATVAISLVGTIRAPITATYIVCIVITGLLIGSRAAGVFTLFSLLALFGILQAEISGLLPPAQTTSGINNWITHATTISMTAVLLGLATHNLNKALDRARQKESALTASNEKLQQEVAERIKAEKSLEESKERFRSLIETSSDWIWEVDQNGVYTYSSPKLKELLGYEPEEIIGKTPFDLMPSDEADHALKKFQDIVTSRKDFDGLENVNTHKDGRHVVLETSGVPIFDENHNLLGYRGIDRDITERRWAEEALKESEERYKRTLEAVPNLIAVTRIEDGRFLHVNEHFCTVMGYSRDEALAKTPVDLNLLVNTSDRRRFIEILKEKGEINNFEIKYRKKDGSIIETLLSGRPLTYGSEGCLLSVVTDISALKRAELELKKSEARFRDIVENMEEGYTENDLAGNITYANKSACRMRGYSNRDFIGMNYKVFMPPETCNKIYSTYNKVYRTGESEMIDGFETLRKDGSTLIVESSVALLRDESGEPIGFRSITRDVTARRLIEQEKQELEQRLARSEKMKSLGLLAGGVAHDLNNVLSGIVSYPDLLLLDIPDDSPLRDPILTIRESGKKAATIVQDLLTLARRGVTTTDVLNFNDIVVDHMKSPENETLLNYHPDIKLETNLTAELPHIRGSAVHLKKTVMNLISNAAEAQPGGGKILVSTENQYIDKPVKGYDQVHEGEYLVLIVEDNGTGIAPDDLKRIFEPFYTKKVMGRSGTGLGMAVVWGTVQDHNGYINVESTVGKGTIFYLYFPLTRDEPVHFKIINSIEDYIGNNESILIIDDVKEQRDIAARILNKLNYACKTVSSGEAAVKYLQNNTADLLVLDMIMDPGIDGLETYKRILKEHPGQKAIIVSGFAETVHVRETQRLGAGAYLRKPYTMEKIGLAIRKELNK